MDEQMRDSFEAFLKEEAPAIYDASNADARYIWTKAWQACAAALSQPATADEQKDAERFRIAIAYEDNTDALLFVVMNNAPDTAAIRAEFDAAIKATP